MLKLDLLNIEGEVLPQVEEFKYLEVVFTSEGRMEQDSGEGAEL